MQWQRNLTVSGISVLPLAGLEATSILTHPGPFIHFTKSEAATIAAVLCIILALSIATVLAVADGLIRIFRLSASLFAPVALALLVGVATALDPGYWLRMWSPHSPAFWVIVSGALAIGAAAILRRRYV